MDTQPDLSAPLTWLNLWELSRYLGVSVETTAEFLWYGQLPAPRHADPLLWRLEDIEQWAKAGCPTRDVPTAGWHFRPSIVLEGDFRIEGRNE